MIVYQDLTEKPDQYEFPVPPMQCWLIVSLEFPISFENQRYLLVVQPYYGDYKSKLNNGEGILYPPFTAFPIDLGYFRPDTLGAMRERIEGEADKVFKHQVVDQVAYNLGLGEPRHEPIGHIDEYKVSPREHDAYKFFRIYRFRCWHQKTKGRRNISDPEALKGHFMVPMDISEIGDDDTRSRFGPHDYRFISKPLAGHFRRILSDYSVENSTEKTTCLEEGDLVNFESGFVALLDLSGYGNIALQTREKRSSPTEGGLEIARRFRFHVAQAFDLFFRNLGTTQSRITGDGFVCGVPIRICCGQESVFYARLKHALIELRKFVNQINQNLAEEGLTIGIRFSLEKGDFVYGRIGGPCSISADFDGEAVIDAARCDQAITDTISSEVRCTKLLIGSSNKDCIKKIAEMFETPMSYSTRSVKTKERQFELQLLEADLD